jgi:hypothetical protein
MQKRPIKKAQAADNIHAYPVCALFSLQTKGNNAEIFQIPAPF